MAGGEMGKSGKYRLWGLSIAVNLLGTSASLEFKELFRGKNDYLKEGIIWIVERGEDKFESII